MYPLCIPLYLNIGHPRGPSDPWLQDRVRVRTRARIMRARSAWVCVRVLTRTERFVLCHHCAQPGLFYVRTPRPARHPVHSAMYSSVHPPCVHHVCGTVRTGARGLCAPPCHPDVHHWCATGCAVINRSDCQPLSWALCTAIHPYPVLAAVPVG